MPDFPPSGKRRAVLLDVLADSKSLGYLGPDPVEKHLGHARRFLVDFLPAPDRALDLGSGGGVPGLILACALADCHWGLLESMRKRCDFLREAVQRLELEDTVEVLEGRAEELAHEAGLREAYDLVTARSFGPPSPTVECAGGFLKVGGHLIVSQPPQEGELASPTRGIGGELASPTRWPADGLDLFGMKLIQLASVAVVEKFQPFPEKYPRKVGQPFKRPLF